MALTEEEKRERNREYNRKHYEQNRNDPEWRKQKNERNRKWRERHREQNREACRKWREQHPNASKEWRKQHPDYDKEWREQHREQIQNYNKKWIEQHPNTSKESYERNKVRIKERYNKFKERWIPKDSVCVNCGKPSTSRHHIDPTEKKFALSELFHRRSNITDDELQDELDKTVLVCHKCHRLIHFGIIVDPELYVGPIQQRNIKGQIMPKKSY